MRNQIIVSFLFIFVLCLLITFCQKESESGEEVRNHTSDTKIKRLNVFKWTTDKHYRQILLKRINENI